MRKLNILSLSILVLVLSACSIKQASETFSDPLETPTNTLLTEAPSPTTAEAISPTPADEVELITELENAHGITFDNKGYMYVGKKGEEIYKISPEGESSLFFSLSSLPQANENTQMHNMKMGPDDSIYVAAGDRILKISLDGKAATFIEDIYSGEWGASDLIFDNNENLYVVHGSCVDKYSPELEKIRLIDGVNGDIKIRGAVGLAFSNDYRVLYVSDVFGKKVIKYTLGDDNCTIRNSEVIKNLQSAEYIAVDLNNNVFVSLPDLNMVAKITPDGSRTMLDGDKLLKGVTTIALGGAEFDTYALYVTSDGKIYRVPV